MWLCRTALLRAEDAERDQGARVGRLRELLAEAQAAEVTGLDGGDLAALGDATVRADALGRAVDRQAGALAEATAGVEVARATWTSARQKARRAGKGLRRAEQATVALEDARNLLPAGAAAGP